MTIQSAQVVIAKKFYPSAGKVNWNLQDTQGVKYSASPDLAAKVQEGQNVMLDYRVSNFTGKDGKPHSANMVERLTVTQGGTPMPAPAYSPPPSQHVQPAPRPSNGPPVVDKDKMIFVTGIVGRAMGGGKFEPEHIRELTSFACAAWAEFFQ